MAKALSEQEEPNVCWDPRFLRPCWKKKDSKNEHPNKRFALLILSGL